MSGAGGDAATARYYGLHAAEVAARYEAVASPVAGCIRLAFPEGCRVLDVGAGSGRDLAALLAMGYDAWGAEPVPGTASAAIAHHPQLSGRIAAAGLPALGEPFGGGFDGILCSAVLMHLPAADLFDAAFALRQALRPHGRPPGGGLAWEAELFARLREAVEITACQRGVARWEPRVS